MVTEVDGFRHEAKPGDEREPPLVCVFAPSLFVTVTIESNSDDPDDIEIHLHPGGQGFWIARLLARLGCRPVVCGIAGGEGGAVLESLVSDWGVELDVVRTSRSTPCRIDDRRSGRRQTLAQDREAAIRRHEVDELYGRVLARAVESRMTVITGRLPGDPFPIDFFARLGGDLEELEVEVAADLHGEELARFLERGRLSMLKISDEDLEVDGMDGGSERSIVEFATRLRDRVGWLVVSRAERGAVAVFDRRVVRVSPPSLGVVDDTGAGDSMTAALVAGRLSGLDAESTIRLGCAAGAANVTRHGRGSASTSLIRRLAEQVEVEPVEVLSESRDGIDHRDPRPDRGFPGLRRSASG